MLVFYSLALLLVLVVGSPYWFFRMATSGKYREGLAERLGRVPRRVIEGLSGESIIWVHAVSVGEVLAASRLIEELQVRATGFRIVVSTTTRTGQTLARERFGADRVFYFPLDFAWSVRAYLKVLRPKMLVLLETEFWPRLLVECRRAGTPVVVVNARISDRSWPRYKRLRFLWKRVLGNLSLVLAQSELDVERLRVLGAANVSFGGNLKYDVRAVKAAAVTLALREHMSQGAKVLVCGSTLEGEEQMLLDAMPPDVVAVIAPRHPERFEVVAQLLRQRGVTWVRRSDWIEAEMAILPGTVVLLDSIGELASVYSLATVAFVGGSLVAAGGHNPLEPAQFGIPIVMGPYYENFRGIVEALKGQGGIRIVESDALRAAFLELLGDQVAGRKLGAQARHVFESEAGATSRAVDALLQVLGAQA